MVCKTKHNDPKHSHLCSIDSPYEGGDAGSNVKASKSTDCTIDQKTVPLGKVNQVLGFEKNMDRIGLGDLRAMNDNVKFGHYYKEKTPNKNAHFCVDSGRKTVNGKRLGWLWVFPDGIVGPSNRRIRMNPNLIWTKDDMINAYLAADAPTLSMWTRHVERYSELAITFCLPFPDSN